MILYISVFSCAHFISCSLAGVPGSNMSSTVHLLDHRHGLSEELGQLFDSGEGCDVDILVQSPTGNRLDNGSLEMEERNICMHRLVLFLFPQFNVTLRARKFTIEVSQPCQTYVTSFIRYSRVPTKHFSSYDGFPSYIADETCMLILGFGSRL